MIDKNDKSALLSQLTIDKSQTAHTENRWQGALLFGVIGLVIGGFLGYALTYKSAPIEQNAPQNTGDAKSVVAENPPSAVKPLREEVLNASGYITARRVATVSSEIMGLITSVDVEEGMSVVKGQILARLDSIVAKVNLDLAKAQVEVQRARLTSIETEFNEARRQLARLSKLKGESFVSEAQLSRAKTDADSLKANLDSTQADLNVSEFNVALLQENYNRHTIRAPFAGVVTVKNAQPGEIVAPSAAGGSFTRTGICTIVDMQSLEIEVDVNEAFINRVYAGQNVIANLDAYPNWDIPASVIAVIPTAIRAKATVQVRIKLEVKDTRILPDMGIKVAFLK